LDTARTGRTYGRNSVFREIETIIHKVIKLMQIRERMKIVSI